MTDFKDFDIEVQDSKDTAPEHFNGSVAVAGTYVSIVPTSTKSIQAAYIRNPNKGPNANSSNVVLLVNCDSSLVEISLGRGEWIYVPGVFTELRIDSTVNGGKYEVILWS